ncbi:hypothetical protein HDV01_001695 [Terramyces sp. JEL0728]|nr:hypothetical protein HDV01_001695 [Terramyces sp. JEL0728]
MDQQEIDRIIKDLFDDPLSDTELDEPPINPFIQKDLSIEEDLLALSLSISKKQKPKRIHSDNHDNCSACLGTGKLICCDSCPRVFHIECLNSYTESAFWQCKQCRHQKKKYGTGLFDELIYRMDGMNPKSFSLPKELRDVSEYVFTHPLTGDYVDSRDVLISLKKKKRKNKLDSDQLDVEVNDLLDFSVKSPDQLAQSSSNITGPYNDDQTASTDQKNGPQLENGSTKLVPSSSQNTQSCTLDTHQKEKKVGLCYKCSKSDLKIHQTSFINSHSFSYPVFSNLQAQRSEMVQCDYCFHYWHLDCLSPPLASIPHQKTQWKQFDLVQAQQLKETLWNQIFDKQHTSDLKMIADVPSEYKVLDIREKWKCPLHTDLICQIDGTNEMNLDSDDTVELLEDTLSTDSNIVGLAQEGHVTQEQRSVTPPESAEPNSKIKRPLFILHYKKETEERYPKRQRKDLVIQKKKYNRKNVQKNTKEQKSVKTEEIVKADARKSRQTVEMAANTPIQSPKQVCSPKSSPVTRSKEKIEASVESIVKIENKQKPTKTYTNVVVLNDEQTIAHYTQQKTIYLSEPKIQLEFINKTKKFTLLSPLSEKFKEFKPINTNINELDGYSDGDAETNNRIVEEMVHDCPNDKKDVAASLLLMQLGLRNRYIKKYLDE